MKNIAKQLVGIVVMLLPLVANAQDFKLLGSQNGVEVYGSFDLVEKGKKDQYVLSVYATNSTGKEFYSVGPWITVKVINSKTFLGNTVNISGENTTYSTENSETVYHVKAGIKYDASTRFRVDSGIEPKATVSFSTNTANDLSAFRIRITPQNVVGTWKIGEGKPFRLDTDGQNLFILDAFNGKAFWMLGENGIYYRAVGTDENPEGISVAYLSSLTLLTPDKILYENSEGISVHMTRVQ